jgi:hypothetical protein
MLALDDLNVPYSEISLTSEEALISEVQSGNVVIIGLTMSMISPVSGDWRENIIGRHHTYESGHYIILHDVEIIDRETYFVVKDPLSFQGELYSDGRYAGDNRLYLSSEVFMATEYVVKPWRVNYLSFSKNI